MLRFLLVLCVLLTARTQAHAVGVWDYAHRADVICAATFDSLEPIGNEGTPFGDSWTIYAVTMNVREVWKGKPTSQVKLRLAEFNREGPYQPFRPFDPRLTYLLFGAFDSKKDLLVSLDLPDAHYGFRSCIVIGEPVAAQAGQPVMTRVTRQLIADLLTPDKATKERSLGALSDYEGAFMEGTSWISNTFPVAEVKASKTLVESQAVPEILRLAHGQDKELQSLALRTAAWLQQTSVIPLLSRVVQVQFQTQPDVYTGLAWSLFHFRNREALPLLQAQLGNPDPIARVAIIEAFEGFRDPVVVPDLKKLLNDPDENVRKRARYALTLCDV